MGGSRPWQLLLLSAHSDSQLDAATWALTEHLRQHSHLDLADVACTLQVERRAFSCRRMVTCTDVEDAVGCLETLDPTRVFTASEVADSANQAVYFMFSGLGAQYLNMGRELYETEPAYRTQVDRCSQLLLPRLGCDLRQVLYPAAGEERKAGRLLGDTGFAQPALFVVEYALARLWIDWGVRPQAMIGHSFGEYVAACLAGVFSLEACLALVTERGRLLRTTAVGAVLSVSLPEQEAVSLIGEELSLAAINAPSLCAVSGPAAAVETVHEQFVERGVECRRLHVGFAAHSRLVDPIVAPFVEEVAKFRLRPPQIPYVSNVTGRWIRDDEATDPGYWGRHLRQPVRFMAGLNELLEDPGAAFLEIGPGRTLVTLANRHSATAGRLVIASMRHPEEEVSDVGFLLNALGRLWLGGVTVDWEGFHAGRQTRCAPLPEGVEGVAAAEILHRRAVVSAAPRNPIEELLAGIWIRVLGRDVPVGIHDNFFDLGGDSLLATRVLSRVGRELRVKPPLRALFERPTVAGLAETVTAALGRDQELEAPPLRPAERRGTLPLSFAQQRLWFLDRLEPGSALYNVPVALRLDGRLDRGALGRALNEIVRRHEVLRTTYEEVDGVPVQVIQSPGTELPLPVLELGGLPEPRRRTEADRLAWDRGRQPFDPQRDLPLRVTLLRLDEAKHVLLLTMHHIACDRWTIAVLLRELTVLYQAFAAGKASPLPELGVQYADFAVWQRQWLTGKVLEAQLAYWREQLAELPVLELPTDRPRPAVQSLRGALERFVLPPRLDRRLRELGRKHGVTLFMTSLAAFHTLLRRHTGQEDVALGSAIAGRNRAEIESLAGFFVNTLILRGDLRGDPTVGELLARSRDVALGAHAHQDLPFEALVEELVPERSLSRNPLVQVLLVLQNAPAGIRELDPGLATELEYLDTGIAKFDLDLVLEDDEGALAGKLAYNADLFDRTTIRRLVRHFRTLLEGLAADPNGRLSQLPLMSAAERHQLLREWNPTPSDDLDAGPRVHELFETQAARIPEAVAVVCADGECLSYGELNRRANRLAHALRARGVERDVPVGLSMEPSPELVVGLLAILKSGGALVPLDPSYPEERLAFMLEDTGISVLLTAADKGPTDLVERVARANDAAGDAYHRSLIPVSQHRSVSPFALVCPSRQQGRRAPAAAGSDADPPRAADPGSLAYVIYTSGSTGRPKGVAIPHGAIAAHCRTMCRQLGLQSGDRVLQSASFNFDVALEQTLPALLRGCRLILRGRDLWLPSELSEKFRELGITVADLPAGYWQRWVEESLAAAESAPLRPLRLVSVGGDVMVPEAACGWGRTPQATVDLLNAYGPTEATITATTFQVPAAGPERCCRHRVPIGRPLAGRSLRILDRRGVPVAIGVSGELCLGGTLLARGYLKRPALTAERFVPDPWVVPPSPGGARLYRTGDLARYRPGGNVEFLGRIDDQVKVRGFRLELGEIEAALAAHPGIRETVVVARESGRAPGDRELVAYLVGEREVAVRELRAFLRERLPPYMLPAAFVFPETLPRLPNGKVDRAALKRQALPEALVSAEELVPPRDATEELLAGIWEEVLSSSGRIGVHDNFFELGGHSLLGTQVLSRVRRTLGIEPPLRILFERPTVAGLAGYVASALRREQGLEAPPLRPVACRTAPKVLPLSFAQQRLWFLDQFEPGSTLYNVPIPLRLTGRLDPRALIRALNDVVSRHEVLRTRFEPAADPADGPVQVIRPVAELPLPVVDLTGLREPQRRDQTRRLMGREARRPFDLARGPLLRAVLLRRGGEAHTLFLAVHHIAFDGWSTGVLLRELATRYQASAAGADSSDPRFRLPELRIQYADFAVWQRQWLEGEVLEGRLAYWQEQLAELPVLELPTDRPRPAVKNLRGATVSFLVPEAIHRRLQELSRRQGSTLFMTLLAAFHTLLGRTTGQQDLAVGSAIANRNRAELEALLGFFVNTLVLRGDLRGDPTFRRLLARVRDVALGAYVHQDLPFEALVERLDPDRHLSQNPLVQVFLVLQNAPLETRELAPGLTVELEPFDVDSAKFDLTLGLEEGEAGLRGTLVYDVDLFDAATMRRMAGHFRRVVEGAVADPDRCLSELPLLSAAELQQLLREWNDTLSPYPSQAPIHQLFEAQAAGTPEAVAVVFGGRPEEQLSYRELNRRANRLAHTLRAQGVDSEQCVGLCVERSVEMVVGTLGILKAGGAYLPLDPSYPPERLAFMLEDAASPDGRPPVLVTQERLAERLPATLPELRTICLDRDRAALSRSGTDNPSPVATAENLAYVMYTSGSTGRPKGVRVVHRGVVRLVRETSYAVLDDREVTLQFAPISFDASTLEIWGPLLNGGRLVVFAAHTPSLEELGATLARHRVTTLWLTAGLFHQMVEENPAGLAGVRQMLAGGDVLSARHVRRVSEKFQKCTVINGYGPTESTTFTCCSPMREPAEVGDPVSIGRPIANTRVHVLDRRLCPVPVGVPGELTIGGDGLARDYLRRPGLTAERFIPNPLGEVSQRLYRTGDLVRLLPDGRIDFLGRTDHQVKLRGFRIELGEVETVLGRHPGVRQAVAMVREDRPGDRRLVAYAVRREGLAELDAGELRAWLGRSLPDYMVPSALVLLDALPLTANGKVDRAALPEPASGAGAPGGDRVAPRNPIEEIMAAIWEQVLGATVAGPVVAGPVGIHDDFFELGGHSLLATQVVSRVRRELHVELPLRLLFEQPTVAGLAAGVAEALRRQQDLEIPPILPGAREGHPALSFAQQRLWFIDRLEPGSARYNLPFSLHLRGRLAPGALARALGEIVGRHEVLRTRFETVAGGPDDGPVQMIHAVLDQALPVCDLAGLDPAERRAEADRLARAEARRPFDLARGPMLRTALLRLGDQEHLLLLTAHHIAFDAWSVGVFLRELRTLYQAFTAGAGMAASALPELPVQYADFALWQRRWLTGEVLEKQLAYWRKQLAGLPVLELPTDRPRPAVQSFRGAGEEFRVPAEPAGRLGELSRRQGATLFMTLLAAFQLLLSRSSAQQDLAVGSPIANRNQGETEGLVGFFVNTLVLRADLSGGPTYRQLLARLRDVALGAYAHQDLPFEKLVEELEPERDLSHNPLVQVLFTLQNAPMAIPELAPGLRAKLDDVAVETAKFDLTVGLEEDEDGLRGMWVYNTDLFDRATIRRLAGHFGVLLRGIARDPDERLSELPLLAPAERHELLYEWNDTASDYPAEISIARLFELQVKRTPEAVALVFDGELLSYRELNRRANRLAHHLLALGVDRGGGAPEVMTGIYMDRSPRTLVAILAILKAGGVYLPLDLSYPPERLAFMLKDAGAPVLISEQEQAAMLPPDLAKHGVKLVCLDRDEAAIARASDRNPEASAAVTGDHLAYVIYTSGSTGIPKGVAVSHRAVARLVFHTNYIDLGADDRVAQASTTSFDAATFELWGALVHGGRLVGISKEVALAPQAFAAALREHRITALFLTTALFNQMVSEDPAVFNPLRHLLFGGEAVDPHWVREALASGGPQRLLHVYGPTESTTYATWQRVREVARGARTVPIGGPLANTEIYVLDRSLEPVPAGVAGELLIAGDGLARGYLKRPGLTAERFIPNPLGGNPSASGSRLYRTGDLVRYLPEGAIEFLGRLDFQVKIRGFRIELGEVEAVLGRHPAVREAFVIADRTESGDQYLVAYVVPEGEAVAAGELREFLLRTLPEYMVPSVVVSLEALPLGPTGKVDRAALPAPARAIEPVAHFVAPRGPVEEALAGIWAEVLGERPTCPPPGEPPICPPPGEPPICPPPGEPQTRPQVGAHDNFFALGGHSLLATRVVSRIRTTLGVELPLMKLFEAPTVAGLAARVEELMRAAGARPAPPIERVPRAGDLQLSFAQERLWFLDRYEPDSPVYNIPVAYELTGRLSPAALAASLGAVVERHEALRTTFGEGPRQSIATELEINLPLVDLRGLPAGVRPAVAAELAEAEARRPFDLAAGPLLRVALLRLEEDRHRLLVTLHHIISDGWSIEVLEGELAAFYQFFTTADRGAPSIPELPIQYPDFAVWQRHRLTGTVFEEQLAYWRERLAGASTALELPFDRPRPPVLTHRGTEVSRQLPAALSEPLEDLGRRQGTTLFMTLLAAFFTLLHRYTGQRDLLVGTPVANRGRREIEGLIGFFVNTLVLRCDLGAEPTVRELLARVREAALGAYAHQDLPFERLVEELRPERDLSRSPLFQAMFGVQRARRWELAPGLPMRRVSVENRSVKFDISLYFVEAEHGLRAGVGYNTDLFDRVTIERLLAHLERLLGAIVEDPERSVSELPLLTPGQEHALLVEWNDTAIDDAVGGCVHELFAQQAARRPAAVAVTHGERVLTYGELGRRADRLARQLRRRGVGPDEVVALFVERSPEMLVGMLGILAAGGAYLPLDPDYPASRLSYMLADAGTWVILTQEGLRDRLGDALPEAAPEVIAVDPSPRPSPLGRGLRKHLPSSPRGEGAPTHPEEAPSQPNRSGPENLAYVIYTSGSTGRPKGVEIRHSGLTNLVRWHQRTYRVTADDRATQVAGLSFDASVREIWPYLTAGASLHLPDQETRLSPTRLVAWLASKAITLGFQPTPLAELLLAEPWPAGTRLRALLTGGDRLHKRPGGGFPCALCNHYGPTENTVVTSAGAVRPQAPRLPTIGRPIANTAVYVVDRRLRPVPVGVAGELVTRGTGLARGYTRRPALSAERFVPDPWSREEGGRLYRTGDLVRWRNDGRVEFLGRIDHQVKIRGYRIELGEIEEVLGEHSGVAEAVVMPRWERLVAWVVPADDAALTNAELRRFLAERLPDYMVPGVFSLLEELPLLPSGKVDRAALPEPAAGEEPESSVAPRGPVEEILAGIWSEVLDCDRVGRHDDFFELGGHSLLAAQVVSRVSRALGLEIALRQLFEYSTVAALAVEIEKLSATDRGVPREPLQPVPRTGPLPLSFAQERLWFLYQLEPESTAYNSINALNFKGSLVPEALRRAFDEIVRRHEVLRTTFAVVDDRPVQRISPPGEHPLLLVDLARLPERDRRAELGTVFRGETERPFELARGPLFRSILVRLAGDDHVLLLAKHHIIFDGWSAGVVVRELATLYRTFATGPQAPTASSALEPLPIQYADFACWQRRHLRGEVLERQLAFWRARLESPQPVAGLATDHPRDPAGRSRAAGRRFRFSAATSNALRRLSKRQGATLFMTLAAAFQTLLHRHSGAPVVVLGAPIANRNHHEIEALIGFFVNMLVMRSDFSDDPTFRQLLERVREETLEAYAHQDLPFEKLVEALDPDRSADPQSLVRTLFAFQNAPSGILELPGVTLHPLEVEDGGTHSALSDFSVAMGETGELLEGGVQYDAALFEAATIEALLDHFRLLLEEIVADPDRRVGDYALMSEAERRRILGECGRIDAASVLGTEIRERLPSHDPAAGIYLLDRKLGLVPLAGEGEIYLEATGSAAAELPGPAAATASLRPHPFARQPGRCLVATGVRGRWRADGRLELPAPEQSASETAAGDPLAVERVAVDQRRARLASRQNRLSETRRALLARRLRGRAQKVPESPVLAQEEPGKPGSDRGPTPKPAVT